MAVLFAIQAWKWWVRMCVNYCTLSFLVSCQGINRRHHRHIVPLYVWTSVAFLLGFLTCLPPQGKILLKLGIKAISQMVCVTCPQSFSRGTSQLCEGWVWNMTQEGPHLSSWSDWSSSGLLYICDIIRLRILPKILETIHLFPQGADRFCALLNRWQVYLVLKESVTISREHSHFSYRKTEANAT